MLCPAIRERRKSSCCFMRGLEHLEAQSAYALLSGLELEDSFAIDNEVDFM